MIAFRHCDRRFPFLWESAHQPPARWHAAGQGPVQYLADTPDGAWAEFLRHEEIVDEVDLAGVSRAMWAVDVTESEFASPELAEAVVTGPPDSYAGCQEEAERLRAQGAKALRAPSSALDAGAAAGWRVAEGLRRGEPRDGQTYVLFGARPAVLGWMVVGRGRPPAELLEQVRHY